MASRETSAAPPIADSYRPVAPARALLFAARLNLKLAGDWLRDGDFESAAETVDRVRLLGELVEFQSADLQWRDGIKELLAQCGRLVEHSKSKEPAASGAALQACLKSLDDLDKRLPSGAPTTEQFATEVPVRSFMKLLDSSYTDAKTVKSLDELKLMAFTLAETANAVQFLRDQSAWRDRAITVRDTALQLVELKPDTDLKVARQQLKNVYERCQACHKEFRR